MVATSGGPTMFARIGVMRALKPLDSMLMIDAAIHDAVMALPPDERRETRKGQRGRARRPQTWPAATGRE